MPHTQHESIVRRPHGYNLTETKGDHPYISGYVVTPNGIVGVYSQMGERKRDEWTNLHVVFNGVSIDRSILKGYTKRGLVTLAARFAKEFASC